MTIGKVVDYYLPDESLYYLTSDGKNGFWMQYNSQLGFWPVGYPTTPVYEGWEKDAMRDSIKSNSKNWGIGRDSAQSEHVVLGYDRGRYYYSQIAALNYAPDKTVQAITLTGVLRPERFNNKKFWFDFLEYLNSRNAVRYPFELAKNSNPVLSDGFRAKTTAGGYSIIKAGAEIPPQAAGAQWGQPFSCPYYCANEFLSKVNSKVKDEKTRQELLSCDAAAYSMSGHTACALRTYNIMRFCGSTLNKLLKQGINLFDGPLCKPLAPHMNLWASELVKQQKDPSVQCKGACGNQRKEGRESCIKQCKEGIEQDKASLAYTKALVSKNKQDPKKLPPTSCPDTKRFTESVSEQASKKA